MERDVSFGEVRFRYNESIFGGVKPELVPEHRLDPPDSKPDSVAPAHVTFTFDLGEEYRKAELSVYPLDGFPKVYASNREFRKWIEDEIRALRKVLVDKDHRFENEIPHLRYADAHQDFHVKVRHFSFRNGKGIIFVTHWNHELSLISNQNLIYRFEGITDDGKSYVTADMPIKVPFLPSEAVEEFEGFSIPRELQDKTNAVPFEKRLDEFMWRMAQRIEVLSLDQFNPSLKHFEDLVASLTVDSPTR